MKKYLLGLFAVALAVGFSAFTTASKNKNPYYVYGLNSAGTTYTIISSSTFSSLPETDCSSGPSVKCLQGFDTRPSVDSYSAGNPPQTVNIESSTNGFYDPQ